MDGSRLLQFRFRTAIHPQITHSLHYIIWSKAILIDMVKFRITQNKLVGVFRYNENEFSNLFIRTGAPDFC